VLLGWLVMPGQFTCQNILCLRWSALETHGLSLLHCVVWIPHGRRLSFEVIFHRTLLPRIDIVILRGRFQQLKNVRKNRTHHLGSKPTHSSLTAWSSTRTH